MLPRSVTILCAAALAALACGGSSESGVEDPRPTSVDPGSGSMGTPTPVIIRGDGFLARTVRPASGGAPTLDASHRAWLGDTELQDVIWVDVHTLRATVPAGLPPGPQPLVVENTFGRRGRLDAAFLVTGGGLGATAAASESTASVGQEIALTLTVKNTGNAAATGITPGAPAVTASGGASASLTGGPNPASISSLGPGDIGAFTWTIRVTAAGQLDLLASATGTDSFSNGPLSGSGSVSVAVQPAAALSATIAASPATVGVGETIALFLTVTNSGGEGAASATNVVVPAAPTQSSNDGAIASCPGSPSPASIASLAAGKSQTFTWVCTAAKGGTLNLSASASGADANSSAAVTSGAPSATVTIRSGAVLSASLALSQNPQGTINVVMTVTNSGGATATGVRPSVLTPVAGQNAATLSTGPTPAQQDVLAGQSVPFGWTYVKVANGSFTLKGFASGTDASSGFAVNAPEVTSNTLILQ